MGGSEWVNRDHLSPSKRDTGAGAIVFDNPFQAYYNNNSTRASERGERRELHTFRRKAPLFTYTRVLLAWDGLGVWETFVRIECRAILRGFGLLCLGLRKWFSSAVLYAYVALAVCG